jgi:hypothetical protein
MSEGSPNLRDTVAVHPILILIMILGLASAGLAQLTPTGIPPALLLAQVSGGTTGPTTGPMLSTTNLDSQCTSKFDYSCEYPGFNEYSGKPCGIGFKVSSSQVIGHCVMQNYAETDCVFTPDGQCAPPAKAQIESNAYFYPTPTPFANNFESVYDGTVAQTPATLVSSEFSTLPAPPGSLADQAGYNEIEGTANAMRFNVISPPEDMGEAVVSQAQAPASVPVAANSFQGVPPAEATPVPGTYSQVPQGFAAQITEAGITPSSNIEDVRPSQSIVSQYTPQPTFAAQSTIENGSQQMPSAPQSNGAYSNQGPFGNTINNIATYFGGLFSKF